MRFRRFRGKACGANILCDTIDADFPGENAVNITQLKNGETATIVAILGNCKPVSRLNAMGIIPGTSIVKKSSSAMKGPVVLEKNGRQLAIGFRMAQMIIVKPLVDTGEIQGDTL